MPEPTLDCQTCGEVLQTLTPAENQKVAAAPYNYVVTCAECKRDEAVKEAI